MKRVLLVAAVARNRVIGHGPDIPWKIPGEQAEFKKLTLGHALVMGRTTYESIGRPLLGRTTIVLTRDRSWSPDHPEVVVVHSLIDALAKAALLPEGEVIVAGGAEVYAEAIGLASELVISEIPLEPEGDVLFPVIDPSKWAESDREHFQGYDRVWYERSDL
ncbi:dihydrofolate reductase [Nocardioides sp.]|uniref:dihydrofolate reductase n=1 Tax=Nocardioides sp. TaxID=35761 RepID=UPI002725C927|nr:dihydrofolate reductase [Nocardioides sp.]MDO9457147.1 dihydrofolate reductase [Nocardioides sp.]